MASQTFIFMLFLLLVFSLHMDEALAAQTEIRKLKETIKMRRNLEGNDHRSSKMRVGRSITKRCQGQKSLKNMATTYRPNHGQFNPLPVPGGYSSSLCKSCTSFFASCYTVRCVIIKRCQGFHGSPMKCTSFEKCTRISGP
ncbi:PREDICTED: uncharacterized protein LOC104776541 isoform X2 [Camelina sativa]|uniref:Uncharacterized protein LOC104776541 isoform X2 n=1 Tax=Camelina sativa TaxID=90675 RepID=A0ABM0YCH7_CAMSA|nr:PREDICTED: uncharacterized protein LOC104776541 isoform X2 [Camelina sativa]